MLPALYAFTFFDCTKNYLKSMGIDYPVLMIHTFTAVLNYYKLDFTCLSIKIINSIFRFRY